jgi:hypothetical protein
MKSDTVIERDERFNWVYPGTRVKCSYDVQAEAIAAGDTHWLKYLPEVGKVYTIESVIKEVVEPFRIGITFAELPGLAQEDCWFTDIPGEKVRVVVDDTRFAPVEN